jgi:hypothetical protein
MPHRIESRLSDSDEHSAASLYRGVLTAMFPPCADLQNPLRWNPGDPDPVSRPHVSIWKDPDLLDD